MEGSPITGMRFTWYIKALNDRQAYVRTVTPLNLNGRSIDYPYVDYMPEMVAAKQKAADFYYAHGNELMKTKLKDIIQAGLGSLSGQRNMWAIMRELTTR